MKRMVFVLFFFIGLASQANSQVEYYTDLANQYQREYMINKDRAEKLNIEASDYFRLAEEYIRLADSCSIINDDEQAKKYLQKAKEADTKGQSCLKKAKEARILYIDQFKMYQDALSKMLRERQRELDDLKRDR